MGDRLQFDLFSFLIGLLSGILLSWSIRKITPIRNWLKQSIDTINKQADHGRSKNIEIHYRRDVILQAQQNHLAAPLFSLEEISIEPHILVPPVLPQPGQENSINEVANQIVPYMPDWPEMAAVFKTPTITLSEALTGGVNGILIGRPGSGKTVALSNLACKVAQRDPSSGNLAGLIPILLHIADLNFPLNENYQPLSMIINSLITKYSGLNQKHLAAFIKYSFTEKRVLLLIDGLDELTRSTLREVNDFLGALLIQYPGLRVVVAASSENYVGLNLLGFIPFAIATWNHNQRQDFIKKWGGVWERSITPSLDVPCNQIDKRVINGWLLDYRITLTPLEFTLKTWAAYACDALGPGGTEAIESYIRRSIANQPDMWPVIVKIALHMIESERPIFRQGEIKDWVGEVDWQNIRISEEGAKDNYQNIAAVPGKPRGSAINYFSKLLDQLIFLNYPNTNMTFIHPTIAAHLAARSSIYLNVGNDSSAEKVVIPQSEWIGNQLLSQSLAAIRDVNHLVQRYLSDETDPLRRKILTVAYWLHRSQQDAPWRPTVMRLLVNLVINHKIPLGIRSRAITALAVSGELGVSNLFQQLLTNKSPDVRMLGVLGCGLLKDPQRVNDLANLMSDDDITVSQAAVLALFIIGNSNAKDIGLSAFFQGDEALQCAAAESLASDPEEGHTLLKQATASDDLLVRRAAVYGLRRVRKPWANQILKKMSIEDGQWVVRTAAIQVVEEVEQLDPKIPRLRPPLKDISWLLAFAGERGIGIASNSTAMELIILAAKEGNPEERLYALDEISQHGSPQAIPILYDILSQSEGAIQNAALNTLWHLSASGIELPPLVMH